MRDLCLLAPEEDGRPQSGRTAFLARIFPFLEFKLNLPRENAERVRSQDRSPVQGEVYANTGVLPKITALTRRRPARSARARAGYQQLLETECFRQ